MKRDDKRVLRKLKRNLKRAGSKRRRRQLQRDLVENPAEAPYTETDFGHCQSSTLNGLDRDSTRRRTEGGVA